MAFSRPFSWIRVLTTTAVLSIGTVALLVGLDARHPTVPPTAAPTVTVQYESPLGLRVTARKQQVEIRWDHSSRAVVGADKGLIRMIEGEMAELIPLDRRDLQDGYVAYTPMTNDVKIRLEVSERDGSR